MSLYIGHCMDVSDGFGEVPVLMNSIGGNFLQIFITSPQSYSSRRPSSDKLDEFRTNLNLLNMKAVVHASFMLNFCNPPSSKIHKNALRVLSHDMNESVKLGVIGVVVHMGKNVDTLKLTEDQAFNNYIIGLRNVLRNTDPASTIILETGAGVGTEICSSIFGLAKIYKAFPPKERHRIKFCIDTCHVFSSGYDLSNPKYVPIFCQLVEDLIRWDNVVCIHLNDSKTPLNHKKDKHADIGTGYIGTKGLKKFIKFCKKKSIPITLETPCDLITKEEQIGLVKGWFLN